MVCDRLFDWFCDSTTVFQNQEQEDDWFNHFLYEKKCDNNDESSEESSEEPPPEKLRTSGICTSAKMKHFGNKIRAVPYYASIDEYAQYDIWRLGNCSRLNMLYWDASFPKMKLANRFSKSPIANRLKYVLNTISKQYDMVAMLRGSSFGTNNNLYAGSFVTQCSKFSKFFPAAMHYRCV